MPITDEEIEAAARRMMTDLPNGTVDTYYGPTNVTWVYINNTLDGMIPKWSDIPSQWQNAVKLYRYHFRNLSATPSGSLTYEDFLGLVDDQYHRCLDQRDPLWDANTYQLGNLLMTMYSDGVFLDASLSQEALGFEFGDGRSILAARTWQLQDEDDNASYPNDDALSMLNLAAALPTGGASSPQHTPKIRVHGKHKPRFIKPMLRDHRGREPKVRTPTFLPGRCRANADTYPTIKETIQQHPEQNLEITDDRTYTVIGKWLRTLAEEVVLQFLFENKEVFDHILPDSPTTSREQFLQSLLKLTTEEPSQPNLPPGAPTEPPAMIHSNLNMIGSKDPKGKIGKDNTKHRQDRAGGSNNPLLSKYQRATIRSNPHLNKHQRAKLRKAAVIAHGESWEYRAKLCNEILQKRPEVERSGTVKKLAANLLRLADVLQDRTMYWLAQEAQYGLKYNARWAREKRERKYELLIHQAEGKGKDELLAMLEEDVDRIREVYGVGMLMMVDDLMSLREELAEGGKWQTPDHCAVWGWDQRSWVDLLPIEY